MAQGVSCHRPSVTCVTNHVQSGCGVHWREVEIAIIALVNLDSVNFILFTAGGRS